MPPVQTRHSQIREVAQSLFRTKGYKATSMRGLASQVGMEASSLYNHIRSKEEILRAICFDLANEFFNAMDAIDKELPAPEKLKQAIQNHLHIMEKNEDAFFVFLHDWKHMGEVHLIKFKEMRRQYESFFEKIIREGIEKKKFQKSDARLSAQTLLSSLNASFDWYKPSRMKRTLFEENFIQLFFNGILK